MIICFEGPRFAGKTVQSEKLAMHINHDYAGLAKYIEFNCLSNKNKPMLIRGSNKNPWAYASSNLIDFYTTLVARHELDDKKKILILDGYYFDTMMTASVMLKEYKPKDYYDNCVKYFGPCGYGDFNQYMMYMAYKLGLPRPDIVFLLIPDLDVVTSRRNGAYDEDDYFEMKTYQEYLLSLKNLDFYKQFSSSINPIIIRDYSTATFGDIEPDYITEISKYLKSNSRNENEIHQIIKNILKKFSDIATYNGDKPLQGDKARIYSVLRGYADLLTPNAEKTEEEPKAEPVDQPVDATNNKFGLTSLQLKIYNELKLEPSTILYHYDEIYENDKYTPRDKFTIIETMIKILMVSIEKGYISQINMAKEIIAKLRRYIESLTDVGEVNIVENTGVNKEYGNQQKVSRKG